MLSELLNVVNSAGLTYNCGNLTNLRDAILALQTCNCPPATGIVAPTTAPGTKDSRFYIDTATTPDNLYWYDGAAWNLVGYIPSHGVGVIPPVAAPVGTSNLYFDTSTAFDTLYWWNGAVWSRVGEVTNPTSGVGAPVVAPAAQASTIYFNVAVPASPVLYWWDGAIWRTSAATPLVAADYPTGLTNTLSPASGEFVATAIAAVSPCAVTAASVGELAAMKAAPTTMRFAVCNDDGTPSVVGVTGAEVISTLSIINNQVIYAAELAANGAASVVSVTTLWPKRLLASVVNTIPASAVSAGVITLPAGTYQISAAAHMSRSGFRNNNIRLRNTTLGTTLLIGLAARGVDGDLEFSWGNTNLLGVFTLAASSNLELQHWAEATTTGGDPITAGEAELYAHAMITRLV
jgi:hypothetical protein